MKLVVGLGNPGKDYARTFHNVGFMTVEKLASRFDASDFSLDKKSNAFLSEQLVFGNKVIFCKPNTYMNLSGDAVAYLSRYYKIPPADILVVYDDVDIEKGIVRARESGSAGTHNGMRDIVSKLGTGDFARVRIGIGLKPNYMGLADYVLSTIPSAWSAVMDKAFALAADFAEEWLAGKPWQDLTVSVLQ